VALAKLLRQELKYLPFYKNEKTIANIYAEGVRFPSVTLRTRHLTPFYTLAISVQTLCPNFPSISICFFIFDHPLICFSRKAASCFPL